jgi:hypothetical protein
VNQKKGSYIPMLNSVPVVPPQPSEAFYPGDALALFKSYTRSSYQAAAGEEPPTGNPHARPKFWCDTSLAGKAPTDLVTYSVWDTSTPGLPVVAAISMTVSEAEAVNIPGVHNYPPRVVDPTDAFITANGVRLSGFNPLLLSTKKEAVDLASSWGLNPDTAVTEFVLGDGQGPFAYFFPPTELRRVYQIAWGNPVIEINAAAALQEMYKKGVGAPGHWDFTGSQPHWISDVPPDQTFLLPAWPVPIRSLLPDEAATHGSGPTGGQTVIVYKKDVVSPYNPAPVSAGGGLTDAQAQSLATLPHISKVLDAIANALNITI